MNFKEFPFKNILRVTSYVIFAALLFYLFVDFLNYHYQIITNLYPQDWNEGANMLPTDYLLKGTNPFDISNNPQSTNLYGIFYSLVVFPFAKIWGNTLLVHHLVVGFFILASCLVIVAALRKNKAPFLLSCAAGMVFYPFLLFPTTTTDLAGPHSLGLFLFLMTFFIPYFLNYSKTSLGISILLGVLAFYTKMYFILGVPLTALYIFLFKSKQAGFLYGLVFLIVFTLSVYIANSAMNCYFNNVFFIMTNYTNMATNVRHVIAIFTRFYQLQKPLFLLIGVNFIVQGVLYIKNSGKPSAGNFLSKINLFSWRAPLLTWDFNIYLYGLIVTTLIIYFSIGRNQGQFLEYPFQLISPFFILYIFYFLNEQRFIIFLGMPLIIITLSTVASTFPKNFHELDTTWKEVDGLIAANNNIYANSLLIPLLLKYHRPVYDSGHSEFFKMGAKRRFLNFQFPAQPEIEKRDSAYQDEIWALLFQKKFDMLIMDQDYHPFLPSFYALYYRPVGIVTLGNFDCAWRYKLIIFVPR